MILKTISGILATRTVAEPPGCGAEQPLRKAMSKS